MKILIFLPVEKKYIKLWEYYRSDINLIKDISDKFLLTNSLWEFLKNIHKFDAVYCWWWHRVSLIGLVTKILKKKLVCTGAIHMFDLSGESTFFTKSHLHQILNKITFRISDNNLFLSFDQMKQITSHIKVKNPQVVYSSLDKKHLEKFKNVKEEIKKKKILKKKILLSILWLSKSNIKRKGLLETIDALSKIDKSKFFFYILGKEGDGLDELKKIIINKKLNKNVKIIINASTKTKEKYFQKSDLFIQPSWCEGQGFAVVEAMSWGLIPVVSRYTAQPEVVKKNGYIINDINENEIKAVINNFCNKNSKTIKIQSMRTLLFCHDFFSYHKHKKILKKIFK